MGFVACETVGEFATAQAGGGIASSACYRDEALGTDFGRRWEHGTEDFADGGEVVVGDPLAEFDEFGGESGSVVDGFGDVADLGGLWCGGGEFDYDADQGFFAEGDEDAGAGVDDFAEMVGDGVGEEGAEGDGEGGVAVGGGGHGIR